MEDAVASGFPQAMPWTASDSALLVFGDDSDPRVEFDGPGAVSQALDPDSLDAVTFLIELDLSVGTALV